jgi:hypothetical protein
MSGCGLGSDATRCDQKPADSPLPAENKGFLQIPFCDGPFILDLREVNRETAWFTIRGLVLRIPNGTPAGDRYQNPPVTPAHIA